MANELIKGQLEGNAGGSEARIMAFTIAKGGQLKTTSVVNIAGAIMKDNLLKQAKVCILDVDPQGHIFKTFGYNAHELTERENFGAALVGYLNDNGERISGFEVVQNCIFEIYRENEHKYIHCISSNELCDFLDVNILLDQGLTNPTLLLQKLCNEMKPYYDFILIDTPPSYSVMITNVLMVENIEVYIPYEPDAYCVESAIKTIRTSKNLIDSGNNPSLKIRGMFATKVKKTTNAHMGLVEHGKKLAEVNGVPHFNTLIPSTIKTSSAVLYEALPSTLSPKATDRVFEYIQLWREMK
ncbi:MAG: ParA family protein [Kurthia sp.]|nr:ParA family protein [Candidatus Kurthia equi]